MKSDSPTRTTRDKACACTVYSVLYYSLSKTFYRISAEAHVKESAKTYRRLTILKSCQNCTNADRRVDARRRLSTLRPRLCATSLFSLRDKVQWLSSEPTRPQRVLRRGEVPMESPSYRFTALEARPSMARSYRVIPPVQESTLQFECLVAYRCVCRAGVPLATKLIRQQSHQLGIAYR